MPSPIRARHNPGLMMGCANKEHGFVLDADKVISTDRSGLLNPFFDIGRWRSSKHSRSGIRRSLFMLLFLMAYAPVAHAVIQALPITAPMNAHDATVWKQSDGWSNGVPFQTGWRADHLSFVNGFLNIRLDNQPGCATGLPVCSSQPFASGEYSTIPLVSYGRITFRAKAVAASGVITGLFTYTGPSDGQPHDEIDIELLGKDTTRVQFNYFTSGTGGHEFLVPLGFDASVSFHDYMIEWLPVTINWYVDGVLKHTVHAGPGVSLPSYPQHIFMNLWAATGTNAWSGLFSYVAPLTAQVDQVSYVENTPPAGTISIDAGKSATNTTAVTLTLTCNDNVACTQMQFSNDDVTYAPLTANAGNASWTLAAGADGVRTVYAKFQDAAGNVSSVVSDTITLDTLAPAKPVITAPVNNTLTNNNARPVIGGTAEPAASVTVTDGATALGMVTAAGGHWSLASGSAILTAGAHSFTALATDAAGNAGPASTAITYTVDTTPPTLTSVSIASNNGTPTLAKAGDVVTLSFTASEALGALPTATIATRIATVVHTGGNNYTASYTMLAADTQGAVPFAIHFSDAAGNAGAQVTTVTNASAVRFDSVAPTMATPGNITVEATTASGTTKTNAAIAAFLNSATTTGATTAVAANNAPAIFPMGITTVTFTAVDAAGNAATPVHATVTIVDTTPPAILGTPLAKVTAEATATKTAVTLTAPAATDLFAVTIANNAPAAGFPVGTTTVIWAARDANGNISTTSQKVIISDTTAPVITLTGSNPVTILAGATYADAGATAVDLVDGNMTGSITVNNPVPNPSTTGIFTVSYNVTDAAGNVATQVTRMVRVAASTTTAAGSIDILPLAGSSGGTAKIVSTGEILFALTATGVTANAPNNINFPFGVIDYSTSVTGASQTIRLTFSTPLPAKPVLYKVNSAGIYTLLPAAVWTTVDANTVDVTLTDGNVQTDLDGVVNGVIHDPLALGGSAAPVTASGGGGCVVNPTASFDPTMLGMLLLSGLYGFNRRMRAK